VPPRILYVAF